MLSIHTHTQREREREREKFEKKLAVIQKLQMLGSQRLYMM